MLSFHLGKKDLSSSHHAFTRGNPILCSVTPLFSWLHLTPFNSHLGFGVKVSGTGKPTCSVLKDLKLLTRKNTFTSETCTLMGGLLCGEGDVSEIPSIGPCLS